MSPRLRDWIDFYGVLLLQFPFLLLVLWSALPFVADSFAVAERSGSAGGLPFRWLMKSMLPISFALLLLATGVRFCEVAKRLFGDASADETS
jgi:TRAP-type mannitol/chloroaromatic compound transport system permease small subunit